MKIIYVSKRNSLKESKVVEIKEISLQLEDIFLVNKIQQYFN